MSKKILWITAQETVTRNIGLVIGEHISVEEANYLLNLTETEDTFSTHSEGYEEIMARLGTDNVSDSEGLFNVEIEVQQHQNTK